MNEENNGLQLISGIIALILLGWGLYTLLF